MDQHVCAQVLFLGEGLAAPRRGARIRLRAEVNVHVCAIPIQPVERLPTLTAAVLLRMFFPIVLDPLLGNRWFALTLVEVEEQTVVFLLVRLFLHLL